MEVIKSDTQIPFDKLWVPALTVSGILVLLSLMILVYQMLIKNDFNWGTDFAGGTEVQIKFDKNVDLGLVRKTLAQAGFPKADVVQYGDVEEHELLIRVLETSEKDKSISNQMVEALKAEFGKSSLELRRVDEVGPKVGHELKTSGFISMFMAMLLILIYIWFRFTPRFAPGAIIAIFHDIIITMGVFAFVHHQFELSTVAALLTIVGYSINDTIVVYDRIRDNMKRTRKGNLVEVVVKSINETLSRTLLTSLTTLFVVFALFIYARGGIQDFAFILMVGIIVGTYSSIFIATPFLVFLEKRKAIE